MAAVLWSLPMLAAGLVALLRYGFGSLFVVGESVAVVLLQGTGADIAGTVQRLDAQPLSSAIEAGAGLAVSAVAAAMMLRRPAVACGFAAAGAAWAFWLGVPLAAGLLVGGAICGIVTVQGLT